MQLNPLARLRCRERLQAIEARGEVSRNPGGADGDHVRVRVVADQRGLYGGITDRKKIAWSRGLDGLLHPLYCGSQCGETAP